MLDKETREKFIITDDPNVQAENAVKVENLSQLPLLIKVLGSDVLSLYLMGTDMANLSSFLKGCQYKWDYRSPEPVYPLVDDIKIPLNLQSSLMNTTERLNKKLVHKKEEANVMVSTPIQFGNFFGFRGFNDLDELHSDPSIRSLRWN